MESQYEKKIEVYYILYGLCGITHTPYRRDCCGPDHMVVGFTVPMIVLSPLKL